ELFVPYAWHQSQQRPGTPGADTERKNTGRGPSAPSTPEKGAKRSTSQERSSKKSDTDAVEAAAAAAAAAAASSAAAVEAPPAPALEIFVSLRLSRPLQSVSDASASTILDLHIDRLSSLPARWLSDVNELEVD